MDFIEHRAGTVKIGSDLLSKKKFRVSGRSQEPENFLIGVLPVHLNIGGNAAYIVNDLDSSLKQIEHKFMVTCAPLKECNGSNHQGNERRTECHKVLDAYRKLTIFQL
jgi:hypothetical protein